MSSTSSSDLPLLLISTVAVSGCIYQFFKKLKTRHIDIDIRNNIDFKDDLREETDSHDFVVVYFGDFYTYVGTNDDQTFVVENCYLEDKKKNSYLGLEAYDILNKLDPSEIEIVETGEEIVSKNGHLSVFLNQILKKVNTDGDKIILWCIDPLATLETKNTIASHLSKTEIHGFIFKISSALSLWPLNLTTGIVIESRENQILIVPIFQGQILDGEVLHIGSKHIYSSVENLVKNQNIQYTYDDILNILDKIVFFSENYEKDVNDNVTLEHTLKNNQKFKISRAEILNITEVFFNPQVGGFGGVGLHHLVQRTIDKCTAHGKQLLRGIVISGSLTKYNGFEKRFHNELNNISFAENLKYCHPIIARSDRDQLPFLGGKRLAQQSHEELHHNSEIISTRDYVKHGVTLLTL